MRQLKFPVAESNKLARTRRISYLCSWQREHVIQDRKYGLDDEGHGKDPEIRTNKTSSSGLLCLAQEIAFHSARTGML